MTTLDAASQMCELPEGVIPESGITIVSYIDVDGEHMFGFATHGDALRSSVIGLLHMVAHQLTHMAEDE